MLPTTTSVMVVPASLTRAPPRSTRSTLALNQAAPRSAPPSRFHYWPPRQSHGPVHLRGRPPRRHSRPICWSNAMPSINAMMSEILRDASLISALYPPLARPAPSLAATTLALCANWLAWLAFFWQIAERCLSAPPCCWRCAANYWQFALCHRQLLVTAGDFSRCSLDAIGTGTH